MWRKAGKSIKIPGGISLRLMSRVRLGFCGSGFQIGLIVLKGFSTIRHLLIFSLFIFKQEN